MLCRHLDLGILDLCIKNKPQVADQVRPLAYLRSSCSCNSTQYGSCYQPRDSLHT